MAPFLNILSEFWHEHTDNLFGGGATETHDDRRTLIVGNLPEATVDAIHRSEMSPKHAGLDALMDE